jgi:hypothetical protein
LVLADRLVRYKIPRSFRFVREELRNDIGKTWRAEICRQEIEHVRLASNDRKVVVGDKP